MTPPLVTPLVDNGVSIEEDLTNIVGSIGELNEQNAEKGCYSPGFRNPEGLET